MTIVFNSTDLRKCRGGIDAANTAMKRAVTSLNGTLDGLGACWGSRSVGQQFAENYVPASTDTRSGLTDLTTFLGNFGSSLEEAAKQYDLTEEGNTV